MLLTSQQAAEYLGMSVSWMETARHLKKGPHYIKIGKRAMYRRDTLDDFIERNEIKTSMQK